MRMIEELIDEIRWDIAFSNSRDAIEKMAAEALREVEAGYVELMDLDKL
ncbi:hypothetical protein [Candidatus Magnetominusculus dajiuhuensis]